MELKIGDKVQIIKVTDGDPSNFLDKIGIISSLDNTGYRPVGVELDGDSYVETGWNFDELKLLQSAELTYKKSETVMRTFGSGATRHTDIDKLDYEGFLSPLVLERYAQYLHKHRKQADGKLRDSDNWQKGIPRDAYIKSAWRHLMAWWKKHRGHETQEEIEDDICAVIFNTMGYLHELLKDKRPISPTNDDDLDGTGCFGVCEVLSGAKYKDMWYVWRHIGPEDDHVYLHTDLTWRSSALPSYNKEWTTQAYVPSRIEALSLYKLTGGKIV